MQPAIAIVGAGLMGQWHAHAARKAGARIFAIVDPRSHAAHELAQRIGVEQTFASFGELLDLNSISAVHICTPLSTHYELCHQALSAGMHTLCEKPLTQNAQQVDSLYRLANRQNRLLWPVHQFSKQRGIDKISDRLDLAGQALRVEFTFASAGAQSEIDADQVVSEILPHPLSVLQQIWPSIPVETLSWSVWAQHSGEMTAIAESSNMMISITISMSSRPTQCDMVIRGDKGTWYADFFHGYSRFEPGTVSRFHKASAPMRKGLGTVFSSSVNLIRRAALKEKAYPGLDNLVRDFYSCMGQPVDTVVTNAAIANAKACDAIVQAARLSSGTS